MIIQKYSNFFIILGFILTITFIGNIFANSFEDSSLNSVQSTSEGSLDVRISSPEVINTNEELKFKVDFLEPGTGKIQVHVDYDFQVLDNNEKEIFSAAKQISQPLLHTAEGSVTIPFTFPSPGVYSINIPVLGINFIPINPESAKFDFTVK
jgi:hypothetical protein